MSSEEFLIEIVSDAASEHTDGQANGQAVVKSFDGNAIAANVNKLIGLVQQFDLSNQGGLELDEVAISIKISATGEAILLNGSLGNGAIVLKFKRSGLQGNSASLTASSSQQEELLSSVGIDYSRLNKLLAEGQWQQANQETWDLMCQALSKNKGSYLSSTDVKQLPCQDLTTIDRLWQKHSQGRFGFSIQSQAYNASIADS